MVVVVAERDSDKGAGSVRSSPCGLRQLKLNTQYRHSTLACLITHQVIRISFKMIISNWDKININTNK